MLADATDFIGREMGRGTAAEMDLHDLAILMNSSSIQIDFPN